MQQKKVQPYFAYADELRKHAPVIAYSCDWLGTCLLIDQIKKDRQQGNLNTIQYGIAQRVLNERMKQLEKDRADQIASYESSQGKSVEKLKEEHSFQIKNFVLAVFVKCVLTEQQLVQKQFNVVKASYETLAIDWYRCSHLIQLLQIHDVIPEQWLQKQNYCKFKSYQTLSCISHEQKPQLGNPFTNDKSYVVPTIQNFQFEEETKEDIPQKLPESFPTLQNPSMKQENKQPFNSSQTVTQSIYPQIQPIIRQDVSKNEDVQKLIQNALGELDFQNIEQAIESIKTAIKSLESKQ